MLMLTHRVPYPPDRGDRIRAYHVLRAIAGRFDVTLATIADEPVAESTRAELDALTSRVLVARARPMHRRAAATRALLTGQAITPAAMLDRALARQIIDLHRARPFDVVLTYCTGMIGYIKALAEALPDVRFRHVLDLVDVDSQKWAGFAETTRGPIRLVYKAEAHRLRAVEAGQVVPFDAVTVISEAEAQRYNETVTDRHEPVVVNNGVDLKRFYPVTDRVDAAPTIVFTGVMSYKPNVDAVCWFARQVMPRVRAAVPDSRFDIVGKSPSPAVLGLDELPGVCVVGPVENTAENLRDAAIAVAPMRIAPGVQNKVLEAMACGLPVVCSSLAASGIDAEPGRELLVADEADDAAAQCVRLLTNPQRREAIGRAARQRVEQRYHWSETTRPMLELLQPTPSTQAVGSL